jgi:hypothetical protein
MNELSAEKKINLLPPQQAKTGSVGWKRETQRPVPDIDLSNFLNCPGPFNVNIEFK